MSAWILWRGDAPVGLGCRSNPSQSSSPIMRPGPPTLPARRECGQVEGLLSPPSASRNSEGRSGRQSTLTERIGRSRI